jgi:hypothetical protein
MKAIQINAIVNLTNGLQIPSGSVAVISEGLAQVFATKDGVIPAQIVSSVYTSKDNYETGKAPVDGNSIADFNPAMYNLQLSVVDYQTVTAETLLVEAVYNALDAVYPGNCVIIDVTAPVPVVTEAATDYAD